MSTSRAEPQADGRDPYLVGLGERVRGLRLQRGMTRKMLSQQARVSERFLASLELGEGNASIRVLVAIAEALSLPVEEIVAVTREHEHDLSSTVELLRELRPEEVRRVRQWLTQQYQTPDVTARRSRIALIGLRGAGKSAIGMALANALEMEFLELDRAVERASGLDMGALL
ncbi:MAG: helix-turn-helix domain-containing protein, partial [Acidobacteriales bacterium]|nr:helix-turn-helix domain-containing protein [Terriglobales bacterium]